MKREWMARELTAEVIVGAFMVAILIGLGYSTIVLSKTMIFSEKSRVTVTFGDVMGLGEGDDVVVRGMPIGRVESLTLGTNDLIEAVLLLDHAVALKTDCEISISVSSVLGGRYVQIREGSREAPGVPPGAVIRGQDPYDFMGDAARIIREAKKAFVEGGAITNLQATMAHIEQIAARLNNGESSLGKLLSKDDQMYKDLQATVASIKDVAQSLQKGEGMIGKALKDPKMADEMDRLLTEARGALDDLRETSPVVTFTSILFGAL